jgi:hypothetical protein
LKKFRFTLLLFVLFSFSLKAQNLTVEELIRFPHMDADSISAKLVTKGWEASNIEFITDSNFVRRTWRVKNSYDDLKSYLILYEYTSDPAENHIIYQFSSRQNFKTYKDDLKSVGYALLVEKKGKKHSRKHNKDMFKEIDEAFYSDKKTSIINISEVFFYGMNTFMIYSYKTNSALGKNLLQNRP